MTVNQPSSEKLVRSVSESAQHLSTVTLTFLAVCVYIGIAVFATTPEVLLLGTRIQLPLFDVQIPLTWFFVLAPFLLVFLHLHLLTLTYLLQRKIARYVRDGNPSEEETDLFFASLPLSILLGHDHPGPIRASLKIVSIVVVMILPLGLLLATQVIFLPYHHAWITTWHKVLLLFDLGLIWYFAARKHDFKTVLEPGNQPEFAPLSRKALVSGSIATLFVVVGSTIVVGGQAMGCEFRTGRPCPWIGALAFDLSLVDRVLLADAPGGGTPSPQDVKGVQLSARNLQGADFTGAVLINADFRGSDLTGAIFGEADLRGARFSPYRDIGRFAVDRGRSSEKLAGRRAVLRGVDLRGAKLAAAKLSQADLRRAHLEGSDLHGADLTQADLRGANLREADLRGANLTGARLVGADLWRARLHGADLRGADLRGAKLVEALAIGADFTGAKTLAADFRHSSLFLARGLILEGADLRGSRWGAIAAPCGEGALRSPKLSDLRWVEFEPESAWSDIQESLKAEQEAEPEDELYGRILTRLQSLHEREPASCLVVLEPSLDTTLGDLAEQIRGANLLYGEPQQVSPLAGWPAGIIAETEYLDRLAGRVVEEACKDHSLAGALLQDIAGELPPARPLLSKAVARRMRQRIHDRRDCTTLWSLSPSEQQALATATDKDPLRTDDSPEATGAKE